MPEKATDGSAGSSVADDAMSPGDTGAANSNVDGGGEHERDTGAREDAPGFQSGDGSVVRCDAASGTVGASFGFDLDGDGVNETNLAVGACAAAAGSVCLLVTSSLPVPVEVALAVGSSACSGTSSVYGQPIHDIGSYAGTSLHEVSVVSCPAMRPELDVVDVAAGSVLATNVAPAITPSYAYTDAPRRADGKRQPFLGSALELSPYPWGQVCIFRYGATDPGCGGNNFVRVATNPALPASGFTPFREAGGYMQDLDGDGWEDVNLYFAGAVYTFSGQTLLPLSTTQYNVSQATMPLAADPWFHGGRNYGVTTAFTTPSGSSRAVQVAGTWVGLFTDYNCGVSRFIDVLDAPAGLPASRAVSWSQYYAFASTIFDTSMLPAEVVLRQPDVLNMCTHFVGDSMTQVGSTPAIVFNQFHQVAPIDTCQINQYDYTDYVYEGFSTADVNMALAEFYDCFAQNAGYYDEDTMPGPSASGTWHTVFLDQDTGATLMDTPGSYLWGYSSNILPGGVAAFLVESPQAGALFNLNEQTAQPIQVQTLASPSGYTSRGVLPGSARPTITDAQPSGPNGSGGGDLIGSLTLQDRDGDGLSDVLLTDGTWVGWSECSGSFAVKP